VKRTRPSIKCVLGGGGSGKEAPEERGGAVYALVPLDTRVIVLRRRRGAPAGF